MVKVADKQRKTKQHNLLTVILFMICSTFSIPLHAQHRDNLETLLPQINADSLLQTVLDLQHFGSRFALREGGNREVAEYLAERLNNYGIPASIDSFYRPGSHSIAGQFAQWFYNVKGILTSPSPTDDSIVIVGAHLDDISLDKQNNTLLEYAPGADDNASGVAVMIELARICHKNKLQFQRDIHFMAYDCEELELRGSRHDAEKRLYDGEKVAVMINNDMVSYQPDENWQLMLHWYDNSMDIANHAADLCRQYTRITPVIPPSDQNTNRKYSDSYAYNLSGFRAVFAIEYHFSTSYHTDHDLADSNNYAYLADVARYNMAMLSDYAGQASGVGIKNHARNISMHLSPNPAKDKVTVLCQLNESTPLCITVFDITGRPLIQQEEYEASGIYYTELDVSNLPAGMYLCCFRTSQKQQTVKFIKQ